VGFFRAHEPARAAAGPTVGQGDAAEAEHGQSVVHLLARARAIPPSRGGLLHTPPTGMSLWDTAVYVVRVRTNVIVLLARATGDYFLAGVGTFGVVFATAQYHLSQGVADVALLALGSGALGGVLLAGRLSDALLRRGRINGRVWVAILGHLLAPVPLLPAFLTHSRWVALPLFSMGAFFLAGTQPALDAIRVDVIVPGLRGRAEAIRQVLRTAVEGGAPLVVGLLAGVLAGAAGLRLAFLATLPLLVVNGLLLLLALRTYPHDVSAALASAERFRQRGAPEAGAGHTP
jgi:MFS-type transporter involved in bile tolerance (Atg22 family)